MKKATENAWPDLPGVQVNALAVTALYGTLSTALHSLSKSGADGEAGKIGALNLEIPVQAGDDM